MLGEGRSVGAVLVIAAVALLCAGPVCAEPATPEDTPRRELTAPLDAAIEIERAPGAEACPDSESVFRSIRRLFPERALRQSTTPSESAAQARVVIRPLSPGYEAVMTVLRPRAGERVMHEKDDDCHGLADALALAFVMLVEPSEAKTPSPGSSATAGDALTPSALDGAAGETPPAAPTASAASRAAAPSQPVDTRQGVSSRGHAFHADLGAAAVGGLGLLSEPAFGAAGRLEFFHRSGWGSVLEGMRLWSPPANAQGGSVTLTLWACLLGPYYRARISRRSSLQAGLLVGLGAQRATVSGFAPVPHPGSFPWAVLMPAFDYRLSFGKLASAFAGLGPVIQIRPQSFSVMLDSTGQTAEVAAAPRVGLMAELGLTLGADIF